MHGSAEPLIKVKGFYMIQISHLASQVVPAVFLDYVAIQRAGKKLAAAQNLKCGYKKYDYQDLTGELALLILEQAPTHDPSKAQPLTRAYNTLQHNLKFKGDAFDYKNFKAYSENQADESDSEDFDSGDSLIGFEIKPRPRSFATEKNDSYRTGESEINEMDDGENDEDDDKVEESEVETGNPDDNQKIGLQALESFEIRNLIDGLAIVKGKKLSDRRKREVLQKNVDHFKKGDLFDGEGN